MGHQLLVQEVLLAQEVWLSIILKLLRDRSSNLEVELMRVNEFPDFNVIGQNANEIGFEYLKNHHLAFG